MVGSKRASRPRLALYKQSVIGKTKVIRMLPNTSWLRCAALLSLSLSSLTLMAPASARQWNPDARGAALDYTQILHSKGNGQVVVVWWVVPETFAGAPGSQALENVVSRYVVVGIADGRAAPGAPMTFANITELKIADQTSRTLSPIAPNAAPPEVAQAISAMQALARQNLGPIGQGMRWFVFDGSTIHSCQPGKMSVPYGGETYSFDTPIPGCPKP